MRINLTAESDYEQAILDYLEENASETLAEKINNGARITVKDADGEHTVVNKKTLSGFFGYAAGEAKKLKKSGNCVAVKDDVVYGWAVHYFEEDSIHGTLTNEDGTPYVAKKAEKQPKKAPEKKEAATAETATEAQETAPKAKEEPTGPKLSKKEKNIRATGQFDLFDILVGGGA